MRTISRARQSGRRTRRPLNAVALVSVVGLAAAACGEGTDQADEPEMGTIVTSAPPAPEAEGALPEVSPGADGDCPYLPADRAGEASGEPVSVVRVDDSLDPPACFFYVANDEVGGDDIRFTTTMYTVESEERATELVAESVPPDVSEPVEVAGEWTGGRTGDDASAMLAVARGEQVFVVHTRDMAPERVQAIAEAGLS